MSFSLELFNLLQQRLNSFSSFNLCRKCFKLSGEQLQLLDRQSVLGIHDTAGSSTDLVKKENFKIKVYSNDLKSRSGMVKNCPIVDASGFQMNIFQNGGHFENETSEYPTNKSPLLRYFLWDVAIR